MKNIRGIVLVFVASLVVSHLSMAGNFDVEIHCVGKKVSEETKKPSGEAKMGTDVYGQPKLNIGGGTNRTKENWVYDVTVENKTFKELAGLEVKYTIFFKQEKLGVKGDPTPQHHNGNFTIPVLKSHEKTSFTTDSVELKKSSLAGNYIYTSGAKPNAQDTLVGLAVRVYQNGQQFAEYANPSTLTKEKWD
jgi:hypothetical protein